MMPFFLCKLADLPGEFQRLRKIVGDKRAAHAFDAVDLHELPVSDLSMKVGDLSVRRGRCVPAAGDTPHLRQCLHLRLCL
jgi:hypothetical protein